MYTLKAEVNNSRRRVIISTPPRGIMHCSLDLKVYIDTGSHLPLDKPSTYLNLPTSLFCRLLKGVLVFKVLSRNFALVAGGATPKGPTFAPPGRRMMKPSSESSRGWLQLGRKINQ